MEQIEGKIKGLITHGIRTEKIINNDNDLLYSGYKPQADVMKQKVTMGIRKIPTTDSELISVAAILGIKETSDISGKTVEYIKDIIKKAKDTPCSCEPFTCCFGCIKDNLYNIED